MSVYHQRRGRATELRTTPSRRPVHTCKREETPISIFRNPAPPIKPSYLTVTVHQLRRYFAQRYGTLPAAWQPPRMSEDAEEAGVEYKTKPFGVKEVLPSPKAQIQSLYGRTVIAGYCRQVLTRLTGTHSLLQWPLESI